MLSTTTTSSPTTAQPGPTTSRPDLAVGLERIANALSEELGDLWTIQQSVPQSKTSPAGFLAQRQAGAQVVRSKGGA